MKIEDIYKQLNYNHKLDDDDKQELAIKIWEQQHMYAASAGTLSTWIGAIAKNHLISKARSKKEKEINMQIPLSYFDREDDGHTNNYVSDFLASDELSPIDKMIASENKKELLQRIYGLDTIYSEVLLAFMEGEYDASDSTQRARLSRAKDALVQNKRKERYKLIDLQAQQEFQCDTLTEAAQMTGMTVEGIRWALNNSGLFLKKSWQISAF